MAVAGGGGPSGIVLGLTWGDLAADLIVIERDDNNSFTSPTEIVRLESVTTTYTDSLPQDGVTRYYRAKHIKTGSADSAWSSSVNDKPHAL